MGFSPDRSRLDHALAGDRDALEAIIKDLSPHIERQLLRYPVTEEDRRDLLQTTLMQVVRRLGSFRGDSSFSTWLFRVTANEALMLMRSQRRHKGRLVEGLEFDDLGTLPAASEGDHPVASDVAVANHERDMRVREALEELPADYREVVVAHYHQDLALDEIAGKFSLSESAVRSRLHRARARLRAILESTEVGLDAMIEAGRAPQTVTAHAA